MKIVAALLIFVIVIILFGLVFINSGLYNIAATNPETGIMKWVLETTKENSVSSRSKEITVPNLDDESLVETGFHHYDQMCVGCHGAPGISPSEIGEGLNPEPPDLSKVAAHLTPAELFWITQNGIKMTGMPAFGPTHSDEEIWGVVAVVEKLPDLSPEDYMRMKQKAETMSHGHDHGHNAHEHEEQDSVNHEKNNQNLQPDVHIHGDGEEHMH